MSLFYEDEFVQLHHGDCRAVRGWTLAEVLVTDPPYGIGWRQKPILTKGRSEGQRSRKHDGIQNDGDLSARDDVLEMFTSRGTIREYGIGDHPHAKPVGLLESLIGSCPPGVIADPFAGSGSTLIAARNLGRKAIGVEIDEAYCELIVKRLSQQAFDFSALDVTA